MRVGNTTHTLYVVFQYIIVGVTSIYQCDVTLLLSFLAQSRDSPLRSFYGLEYGWLPEFFGREEDELPPSLKTQMH